MYVKLFEKHGHNRENLWSNKGSDLMSFKNHYNSPLGVYWIDGHIGRKDKHWDGWPTILSDSIQELQQLHPRQTLHDNVGRNDLHGQPQIKVIQCPWRFGNNLRLSIYLSRAHKIHKALECAQKGKDKEKEMEINTTFLTNLLEHIIIKKSLGIVITTQKWSRLGRCTSNSKKSWIILYQYN